MSGSAMEWAANAQITGPMSHTERLVLIVLAKHAQPDGSRAFPGRTTIGGMIGVSTRSVSRALAALLDAGFIQYGDQAYVAHYPVWSRPIVYNLAIWIKAATPARYSDYSSEGDQDPDDVAELVRSGSPLPPPDVMSPDDRQGRTPCQTASVPPVTSVHQTKNRTNNRTSTSAAQVLRAPPVTDPVVQAARVAANQRPDGSCRDCDGMHPAYTSCQVPAQDITSRAAQAKEALRAARQVDREEEAQRQRRLEEARSSRAQAVDATTDPKENTA